MTYISRSNNVRTKY